MNTGLYSTGSDDPFAGLEKKNQMGLGYQQNSGQGNVMGFNMGTGNESKKP